jgi:phosphoenolpyruvate carboxylase
VKDLIELGDVNFPADYLKLSENDQMDVLSCVRGTIDLNVLSDELAVRTMESIFALKTIQERNGERGANRYIISNNQSALNIMQTFAMLNLCGFEENVSVDVIPLFETIEDLKNAEIVMRTVS